MLEIRTTVGLGAVCTRTTSYGQSFCLNIKLACIKLNKLIGIKYNKVILAPLRFNSMTTGHNKIKN